MVTRKITVVTITALLNGLLGCSSSVLVRPSELKEQPQKKITKVELTSGDEITFLPPGGVFDAQKQVIWGTIRDSVSDTTGTVRTKEIEINPDDIRYIEVKKFDPSTTFVGCTVGTIALLCICVLIVSQIDLDLGL